MAKRVMGKAAEARAANDLVAEGMEIIGSQISVRTSAGRRVVDHIARGPDGTLVAIEVKSGGAVRSANQKLKNAAWNRKVEYLSGKIHRKNSVTLP